MPETTCFDPSELQKRGLQEVREEWLPALSMHEPLDGMSISCLDGQPGTRWAFQAEGPPAFSFSIMLRGRMHAAFDDGAAMTLKAGEAFVMMSNQHTRGWDELDAKGERAFRMLSVYLSEEAMGRLAGLRMDELRTRLSCLPGNQPHVDAFLGKLQVSDSLLRIAGDLVTLSTQPDGGLAGGLFLRAKAFEALGCLLRDNVPDPATRLAAPLDRRRLTEAHALLKSSFQEDWNVQSLARAVGLNEKRLQAGFQSLFGDSVHACLTRIRLDAASAMLARGASVTETAYAVGFSSLSHFSRIFRTHAGCAPRHYGRAQGSTL